jgi:hypothetical protein
MEKEVFCSRNVEEVMMQTYHFHEVVNNKGVVTLSGLPPLAQVVVVVIQPDVSDWQERIPKWK